MNKQDTQHTPLPWDGEFQCTAHDCWGDPNQIVIQLEKNTEDGPEFIACFKADKQGISDLEFVKRAVNAHDDLMAALEALLNRAVQDAEEYAPEGNEPIWAFINDASDALVKAKGGSQ